jgi:hypothetical protein
VRNNRWWLSVLSVRLFVLYFIPLLGVLITVLQLNVFSRYTLTKLKQIGERPVKHT